MGYYTTYTLKVYPEHCLETLQKAFYKLDDCDCFDGESIKWYDCDQDCLKVSGLHPTVLFSVYGDGENKSDLWRKDYMNGQCVGEWETEPDEVPDADPELITKSIEANPVIKPSELREMPPEMFAKLRQEFADEATRRGLK